MSSSTRLIWGIVVGLAVVGLATTLAQASGALPAAPPVNPHAGGLPWWGWPILLFITTFGLGVVAVLAGVGGGVLFVPIVGSFFPFHLDFVRGTGLLVALAGALSASPELLRRGVANLRLALPAALIASIASIAGALVGLALPPSLVQTALGGTILAIAGVMLLFPKSDYPMVEKAGALAQVMGLQGSYQEGSSGEAIAWRAHRVRWGLLLFVGIGFLAGMFGLGAGWANVPVLNLVMGVPLKLAVGTSMVLLSVTDTSAAWIYLHQGAVLPLLTVPSVLGMMLGAKVGCRLLVRTPPSAVRKVVLAMLVLAGLRALLKGLGVWV
jgi:uncharacterized membrane protein YfcA